MMVINRTSDSVLEMTPDNQAFVIVGRGREEAK
jgi:hypothetical protein